jgi:hypothetical protein
MESYVLSRHPSFESFLETQDLRSSDCRTYSDQWNTLPIFRLSRCLDTNYVRKHYRPHW